MNFATDYDLLVLGAGMAGMAAAAQAAVGGARVVVCEVSDHVGGTALLSTGNVWTVPTADAFTEVDPDGDVTLWQVVRDGLYDSLEWIAGLGVAVRERHQASSSSTYDPPPVGRNVDVEAFMAKAVVLVERAGGVVLRGTTVTALDVAPARVSARIRTVATGDEHDLSVGAVVLASGGFQMDPALRRRYLGAAADNVALRSNPHSRGAGLTLALAAGAATSPRMDTFYGVLVPAVPGELTEADYRGLVLHACVYGVALAPDGNRMVDESAGAVGMANAVAQHGTAALVFGEAMIREADRRLGISVAQILHSARGRGARVVNATSVHAAAPQLDAWGLDTDRAVRTLHEFDRACRDGGETSPRRRRHRWPAGTGAVAVAEVKAAVTSTFGGIRTDAHGQVLGADGVPVPGLFAAGVDQGGFHVHGYSGGLSRALVFGRRAATRALSTVTAGPRR